LLLTRVTDVCVRFSRAALVAWCVSLGACTANDAASTAEDASAADSQQDVGPRQQHPSVEAGAPASCTPRAEAPFRRCTGVAPVASLVQDFESGDYAALTAQSAWFDYDDGSSGSLSVEVRADGDNGVLHAVSNAWTVWGAGIGVLLHAPGSCTDYCAVDGSAHTGVRFRARGQGHLRLILATPDQTPVSEGGSCQLSGENCFDQAGADFELTQDWQVLSFPFCLLRPEGWGVSPSGFELDVRQLTALHFRLTHSAPVELWLDDVEFYVAPNDAAAADCSLPCPLDAAPSAALIDPEYTELTLSDELGLYTFEQQTTGDCGSVTRRYLSYVPQQLGADLEAPVLFALHGSGANAESMQGLQTHGGLDELAEREGFIVVYGNAAPGAHTDPSPFIPNSGAWRQSFYDDGQVDDVEYLQLVLADLRLRGVIGESNPVYLTGLSNGGGMVLEAARRAPEMFAGIAPVMPFDGWIPSAVPDLTGTGLSRVLFAYAPEDPGLPDAYTAVLEGLPAQWAAALGMSPEAIAQPLSTAHPDVVQEGDGYVGEAEAALATRDSRVTQFDFATSDGRAALRVLRYERAGHFWPHPMPDSETWIIDRWGFRNQDVDASVAVVEFLLRP
jgi:polyhydroxybutyrate depolymerase